MKVLTTLLVLFCMIAAPFIQAEPVRTDFAYGLEINAVNGAAVGELQVPLTVYQRVAFDDLRDIRVFNADGELVPHAIRAQAVSRGAAIFASLPVFPLRGDVEVALKNVQVTISAAGEQLALRTRKESTSQPVVAYLIDARSARQPLVELELQWLGAPQFSTSVKLEASDDLQSWRAVVYEAPLVNLQFGGQTLTERRMDLPPVGAKYLRLTWRAPQAPFELQSVRARMEANRSVPVRESMQVAGTQVEKGEYQFDIAGRVPVRELNVDLPEINTVVQVEVLSRSMSTSPWRSVTTATLYRLSANGQEIRNRAVPVHSSDRYWAVRVASTGGGLGRGMPVLSLAWEPQRLLFVARGKEPFLIALGNNRMERGEATFDVLLNDDSATHGLVAPQSVQVGRMLDLGGGAKLKLERPIDWKRYLLWAVLILGVGLLIFMARGLLRETSAH